MDDLQKFNSDILRIKKHDRADNGGSYDGRRACRKICDFFCNNNKDLGEVGASFADYWMQTYVATSNDYLNEPSDSNIEILVALQALLEGRSDGTECLSQHDWKELCALVNYDAENIPIELLNDIMIVFVDHGAID